jgi:hypothetical protein
LVSDECTEERRGDQTEGVCPVEAFQERNHLRFILENKFSNPRISTMLDFVTFLLPRMVILDVVDSETIA